MTVKYRWFAKSGKKAKPGKKARSAKKVVKVRKARGARKNLVLTKGMRGKRYRVEVTVSAPGHRSVTFTTKWSKKVKPRR